MKIPSLKNNFGKEIIERGYKYYKEGRVKNLIIDNNKAKAVVHGSRNYRVTIDLTNGYFKCTCPYEFNCKHAVAIIYSLGDNAGVKTSDDLTISLAKKSKDELVEILRKILVSEPRFKKFISNSPEDIEKAIKSLESNYDEDIDKLIEDVDDLYDSILKQNNKIDILITLFRKCFRIYEEYGGIESLEESMFEILETISKEAKRLPKTERQKMLQELVDVTEDYDFFWDSIDDNGIKLDYKGII